MLKKVFPIFILLILIIPTFSSLLRKGYFPMHDDMQAMRLLQLDKCSKDGQIPCRWVPDMGYGYGYPQFNYYAPLPYYIMEGFHLLGLGFLDSVKAGFAVSVIVSAIGMYLLGNSLWGRSGGLISSLLYSYANYRAVDIYVRGALGELWALAFLPFIFWSVKKLIEGNKKSILYVALSLAALFASHNISTLIFIPVFAFWIVYLFFFSNDSPTLVFKQNIKPLIISFIWSFLLAAFFLLPAWFEKKYVHIETLLQGYFNYLAHFVSIGQLLFSTYWGYGSSEVGPYDDISLSVGILTWIVPILSLMLLYLLKKKKEFRLVLFFLTIAWLSLFMIHSKSTFIWQRINVLEYLQFPWRFLTIATFSFSAAAGSVAVCLKSRKAKILMLVGLYLMILLFSKNYFQPQRWLNITDNEKFSGELWEKQLTISIFDYLPIFAKAPPAKKAPDTPLFIEGEGEVVDGKKGTDWQKWQVFVESSDAKIRFPLYYFPNWQVWIDGNLTKIDYQNDLGLVTVDVNRGKHELVAQLQNTSVRTSGNILSLIGLIAIPIYLKKKK